MVCSVLQVYSTQAFFLPLTDELSIFFFNSQIQMSLYQASINYYDSELIAKMNSFFIKTVEILTYTFLSLLVSFIR